MAEEITMDEDAGQERAERVNQLLLQRQASHGRYGASTTLALRAQQQVISEEIAQERFGAAQQRLELDRVRTLVEIQREKSKLQQQMQAEQHTAQALKGIGGLDHNDPDFTKKLAGIFAENPMAAKDPVVQDIVRSQIASKKVVDDANIALYKEQGMEATREGWTIQKEKNLEPIRAETAGEQEKSRIEARNETKTGLAGVPEGVQTRWSKLQADIQFPAGADAKTKQEAKDRSVVEAAELEKLHPQLKPEKTGGKPEDSSETTTTKATTPAPIDYINSIK